MTASKVERIKQREQFLFPPFATSQGLIQPHSLNGNEKYYQIILRKHNFHGKKHSIIYCQ